jgi:tetratricopeptide (TPR) repeat protein
LSEAKGQPAVAMAAYAKILGDDPGKPTNRDALAGYVRTAVASKQLDPATAFLSKLAADATRPDDAAAADLALSVVYRSSGDAAKADSTRAAAIEAAPKQPAVYLDQAAALRQAQPAAAIAVLNQGVSAGAPAEPLLMARAAIEDASGDKDAAIASYRDVLKANPRAIVAANNYASLVADAKPHDKALLADAREPIRGFAGSSNPEVLDTLAWIDYRLGDFQSAKDLLTKAKADTSTNPQLRFHYGAVLIALGDKDAGRTALKGALGQAGFPGQAEAEHLLTE